MQDVRRFISLVLIGLAARAAGDAPARLNLAVSEFRASNASGTEASAVTGFVRSAIYRSGKYTMVDKSDMDKILAEQAFQQTGCTSEDCAVKLGKILNVHKIVVGEYTVLGQTRFLTASLIDVETGRVEGTAKVRGFDVNTADDAADRLVAQLFRVGAIPSDELGTGKTGNEVEFPIGLFLGIGLTGGSSFKSHTVTVDPAPVYYGVNAATFSSAMVGGGVRYQPAKWLMIEGLLVPENFKESIKTQLTSPNPAVSFQGSGASRGDIQGLEFAVTAQWARPLFSKFQLWAGGGIDIISFNKNANENQESGADYAVGTATSTRIHYVMKRPFIFFRPVLQAALEWRPQPRFGWSIRGAVYPVSSTTEIDLVTPNSSGGSTAISGALAELTLPRVAAATSLALYF